MASQTIKREDLYPVGTSVSAYARSNWPQSQLPPSGAPVGSAAATATVQADGTVTLAGLADATNYYAAAQVSGVWRYVAFMTPPASASSSTSTQAEAKRSGWLGVATAIDETVPLWNLTQSAAPTSGTLRLSGGIVIPNGKTVTSISVRSSSTALVTGSNQWFCLVRRSDLAVLGKTTDDTTAAWGTNTVKTLNLSTPYTATADVAVYLGVLIVAVTMPTLNMGPNVIAAPPIVYAGNSTAALTNPASLGATAAALTAVNGPVYGYIS